MLILEAEQLVLIPRLRDLEAVIPTVGPEAALFC